MNKNENIFYTWQGKNIHIPPNFAHYQTLARHMFELSQHDIYASSLPLLETFCKSSLEENHAECFCSVFIYTIENKIVGFLNCRVAFEECEIDTIFVEREHRRAHIAHKLFDFLENTASTQNSISSILLEVGQNNAPAISFYKKRGFLEIYLRKKYYKTGENALVMRKNLSI